MSALPTYPSMAACTAATGIPRAVLQLAKKQGCPAFDAGNRVHLSKLLPWLFRSDDEGGGEDWGTRLKRAQALTAELKLEQTKKRLVDVDIIERVHQRVGLRSRAMLVTILEDELPAKSAGRDAAEIRALNREAGDRVCLAMSTGLAQWVNEVEKAEDGENGGTA